MELDYSKVSMYGTQIKVIKNSMQQYLDNVKQALKSAGNNWTGTAADNFFEKATKLVSTFDEFTEELDACVLYMQKCSMNYSKVDDVVKNSIDKTLSSSRFYNK